MRQGYETILKNAEREIRYVADFVKDLQNEQDIERLWRAWSGLLGHYVNAVSALRRATDQGASKSWSDKLIPEQKNDVILYFAFQARNEYVHNLETERETKPGGVNIAGNAVRVEGNFNLNITFDNCATRGADGRALPLHGEAQIREGKLAKTTLPVGMTKQGNHYVVLSAVKARDGSVLQVPNPNTPKDEQAVEVASYVRDWLQQKLAEAKALAT